MNDAELRAAFARVEHLLFCLAAAHGTEFLAHVTASLPPRAPIPPADVFSGPEPLAGGVPMADDPFLPE